MRFYMSQGGTVLSDTVVPYQFIEAAIDSSTGELILSYANTTMPLPLPFGTQVHTRAS